MIQLILTMAAIPFHAEDKPPSAICPKCSKNGDKSPKQLFAIRDLSAEDGVDKMIPSHWLNCPPIDLDVDAPGMEAMRVSVISDDILQNTMTNNLFSSNIWHYLNMHVRLESAGRTLW